MNDTDSSSPPAPTGSHETPAAPRSAGVSIGMVVGFALLAAGAAGFLLGRQHGPAAPAGIGGGPPSAGTPSAEEGRQAARSREQQLAAHRLSGWRMDPFEALVPGGEPTTAFEPTLRPAPPYDAVDSTLFDAFDVRIRLAHARPVGRDEACLDPQGNRFACGLRGRASLQNFLFGKPVSCLRLYLGREAGDGIVDARCSVEGVDLALRQIRAGWAFPSDLADADQRAALEAARRDRAGVWAGPYDPPRVDHSVEDARAVPFGSLRQTP